MKKLDKLFNRAKQYIIDNDTKIVIMSDCHRGVGNNSDNFIKNRPLFEVALNNYYDNGFTYIELGDGDELWEVKNYKDIIDEHLHVFKLIQKFHDSKRLIMFYGNHDIYKRKREYLEKNIYKYYDKKGKKEEKLLYNLIVHEALIFKYYEKEIFMIHGHQIDILNGTFWKLARFLVRHIWHPIEKIGIKDLTGSAKNYSVSSSVEKKLRDWSIKKRKMVIAGHTHRAIYPKVGKGLYFNDGSCIHYNGITCLEIENGSITLVKWIYKANEKNILIAEKVIMEGPEPINNFF